MYFCGDFFFFISMKSNVFRNLKSEAKHDTVKRLEVIWRVGRKYKQKTSLNID